MNERNPTDTERSTHWPALREQWLKDHPYCELCGHRRQLEVHHIMPFHIKPELELDPHNLITLCESKMYGINCHLFMGHFGNYAMHYNPNVVRDARHFSKNMRTAMRK